jgi:hypothetical protein
VASARFSTYGDLLGNRGGVGGEHYFQKTQGEATKKRDRSVMVVFSFRHYIQKILIPWLKTINIGMNNKSVATVHVDAMC